MSSSSFAVPSTSGRRVSLRAKLLGTSLLLLLFTLIVGALGIRAASSISAKADHMFKDSVEPLADLGAARAAFNENRAFTVYQATADTPAEKQEFDNAFAENAKVIDERLASANTLLLEPEEQRMLAELHDRIEAYRSARREYLSLPEEEAQAFSASTLRPQADKISEIFQSLFDDAVKDAGTDRRNIAATARSSRTLSIIAIVFAIVSGLAISLWISSRIQRSVAVIVDRLESLRRYCTTDLREALTAVARGDLTVTVTPATPDLSRTTNDEIGEIADAVAQIRANTVASVEAYNDMRAQLAEVIGELAGSAAAAQISDLIRQMQSETSKVVDVVAEGAKRTEESVGTVERTRDAFEAIGAAVEDMTARVGEIASAVDQIAAEAGRAEREVGEVATVAEASSASAQQVSASTQQTSASTQEIAASAQSLAATAEQLDGLVRRFKVAA
jgi:methyl-accepting chemotaxis protein